MKGKLLRPTVVALAIAGALLAAGGIAYATIPDSSGVIHACYKTNQGTLRVIDTGQGQTPRPRSTGARPGRRGNKVHRARRGRPGLRTSTRSTATDSR
jgi:hypothetical protein